MEYGGFSYVGCYIENFVIGEGGVSDDDWVEVVNQVNVENVVKCGDWIEIYIVDFFDYYFSVIEMQFDFVGNVQWVFKDFGMLLRL